MPPAKRALIVEENSMVPLDRRVWYEATTLRDAGWDVAVICPADRGAHAGTDKPAYAPSAYPEDLEGIKVYRFPLTFAEHGVRNYLREYLVAFISIARLSWRVWRDERFDVLHICNPPDIFFPIGLFYRLLGAKFIFDHHDLFPENVAWRYQGLTGKLLYALARGLEYLTFRCANLVIVTNESYRQVALGRGNIPKEKVVVVRNGPKLDEFQPLDPIPVVKKGFLYMACFVGLMGNEDGIMELVQVIKYLVHELGRQDILFVLIGDGPERSSALERIQSLELENFVEMPGFVQDGVKLRQYMSTADLFLSPEPKTPMNEKSTFVKIGEYMAMGKPIVAFDLKETQYTAREAAVFVRPGDIQGFGQAISSLLDAPEEREHRGMFGQRRVRESLAWEHQKQNLFTAYQVVTSAK